MEQHPQNNTHEFDNGIMMEQHTAVAETCVVKKRWCCNRVSNEWCCAIILICLIIAIAISMGTLGIMKHLDYIERERKVYGM